jgi:hypothetical protein
MTNIMYSTNKPLLFLAAVALAGCDSSSNTGTVFTGEAHGVAVLVDDMNDVKGSPKKAATIFAKGAAPSGSDLRKYGPYNFSIVGKPSVNGSDATAEVSIRKEVDGAEVGKTTWTFSKEGEAWKIKSAPLP